MSLRTACRAIGAAAVVTLTLIATTSTVVGHPMGSFSISVSSQLVVDEREIRVRWVLDMAEIPAAAIVPLIDADADGVVTADEKHAYFEGWVGVVLESLELTVDGEGLPKTVVAHELTLPSGEGGSPALRVTIDLTASLPKTLAGEAHEAFYRDANYQDYPGWREVVVAAATGVEMVNSSVETVSRTDGLSTYPPDLGVSPPNSEATFTFVLGTAKTPDAAVQDSSARVSQSSASAFSLWPTGVLALAMVGLLLAVMLFANRGERR